MLSLIESMGESPMVKVTDNLEETRGKRFVRLSVLPLPADPTIVAGEIRMDDPDPKHTISSHRSSVMGIESAWELARKIAREREAEIILIVDPKGLFATGVVDADAALGGGQVQPS
jgi:hypothetical protein